MCILSHSAAPSPTCLFLPSLLVKKRRVTETACGQILTVISLLSQWITAWSYAEREREKVPIFLTLSSAELVCFKQAEFISLKEIKKKQQINIASEVYSQICKRLPSAGVFFSIKRWQMISPEPKKPNGSCITDIHWSPCAPLSGWPAQAAAHLFPSLKQPSGLFLFPSPSFLRFREQFGLTQRGVGRRFVLVFSQTAPTAAASWGSLRSAASQLTGATEERRGREKKRWTLS